MAKKGHIPWNKGKKGLQVSCKPMLGKKHSKEAIEKMRKIRLGKKIKYYPRKKPTKEALKNMSIAQKKVNRSYPLSEEHKRKIGLANSGKNHPMWKGGVSKDKYYIKVRNYKWRKENPEKIAHYKSMEYSRKKNATGKHTLKEWETLKAQYNWTCPCCKKCEPEIKLTKDHIIPLVKGGSNNIENIQPLCGSCNSRKHTKETKYY